jgi:DNA invertase Pin-like site-specific DNA recombinase
MVRAAIYCRISQDRAGAGLGVSRQEDDCRALCERRGWEASEVYVDNDVSAYSGKARPAWQRLISDVQAGDVDAVVSWHVDRLTRSPRELEDVIDLADKHGLELATVTGEVDLSNPTGRLVARMLGAAARHEAEHKAERQKRQRRQAAEAGRVGGGGGRPFGYADDRVTVVEVEAAVIRECAARALAGESLASICRDLGDRGITTTGGKNWLPTTLRRLLGSARISGRREHIPRSSGQTVRPLRGEIVADAVWPAIISPIDSDRLRALLSDPDRRKYVAANGRSYLLSGILRCKLCKGGMVGRPKSGTPRYVCPNTPGGKTCGRMATVAERTDEHIRDLILDVLDSPAMMQRLQAGQPDASGLDEEVRACDARLEELAESWAAGEITRKEWMAARALLEHRGAKARAQLVRRDSRAPLRAFIGTRDEMLTRWRRMNVSQQRNIVSAVLRSVIVAPADPSKRWDPDRFEDPEWIV